MAVHFEGKSVRPSAQRLQCHVGKKHCLSCDSVFVGLQNIVLGDFGFTILGEGNLKGRLGEPGGAGELYGARRVATGQEHKTKSHKTIEQNNKQTIKMINKLR